MKKLILLLFMYSLTLILSAQLKLESNGVSLDGGAITTHGSIPFIETVRVRSSISIPNTIIRNDTEIERDEVKINNGITVIDGTLTLKCDDALIKSTTAVKNTGRIIVGYPD